jgi:hypothetical protein
MDTAALQQLTLDACPRGGRLWPNRLGFEYRRWTYAYSEADGCWYASYRPPFNPKVYRPRKLGKGATPTAARAAAKVVE